MEGLNSALDAVEQYCAQMNRDLVSRARIAVEELFSNTIKYGHGGESDHPVRLYLSADPVLTLVYEDDAPPFDPTSWKSREIETLLPDARPEGSAGIAMVRGLCADMRYRLRDGRNCLTLIFA